MGGVEKVDFHRTKSHFWKLRRDQEKQNSQIQTGFIIFFEVLHCEYYEFIKIHIFRCKYVCSWLAGEIIFIFTMKIALCGGWVRESCAENCGLRVLITFAPQNIIFVKKNKGPENRRMEAPENRISAEKDKGLARGVGESNFGGTE